jgi:hypothetical protein
MATLTPQIMLPSGLKPTFVAASAGGDEFPCPADQRTYIEIVNGDASAHTVTLKAQIANSLQAGVGQKAVADISQSLAASERWLFGPIPEAYIRADGKARLEYNSVTSVTLAIINMPRV